MTVGYKSLIFADTLHPADGTVAVIVKPLVHRSALTNLHHANIGNKMLHLIASFIGSPLKQTCRMFEIHAHKCTETHVVKSLRNDFAITLSQLARPYRRTGRSGQILIMQSIRHPVERIGLHEPGLIFSAGTRNHHYTHTHPH